MHYTHLGQQRLINNLKNTYVNFPSEDIDEGSIGLQKADELGILGYDPTDEDFEKGRPAMPIGAHASWNGVDYLKTAAGWKPAGKHRGHVKENHDHIHKNEVKDKDHLEMVHDAGKMSEEEWTAKHGSKLHGKYKEVHDYIHREKKKKEAVKEETGAEKLAKLSDGEVKKLKEQSNAGFTHTAYTDKEITEEMKKRNILLDVKKPEEKKEDPAPEEKKKNVYGVSMTSIEEMTFSKWLSNNNIAMNTKTAEERKQIAEKFLQKPTHEAKKEEPKVEEKPKEEGLKTQGEYLDEQKKELGDNYTSSVESELKDEHYKTVEDHVKSGKQVPKPVYDSLDEGKQKHFDKHHNHRGDKIEGVNEKPKPEVKDIDKKDYYKTGAKTNEESKKDAESAEVKKFGEELKEGDKVVVYPDRPDMGVTGKVVKTFGVNGVKVDTGNGSGSMYHRKEVVSQEKHDKDFPIGSKSPDGKYIKTANGWEYIKEDKAPAAEENKAPEKVDYSKLNDEQKVIHHSLMAQGHFLNGNNKEGKEHEQEYDKRHKELVEKTGSSISEEAMSKHVEKHLADFTGAAKDTDGWNKNYAERNKDAHLAGKESKPAPTPEKKEEAKPEGGNFQIATPAGHLSVKVVPNSKEGHFGVQVSNHVKNADGTEKIQMKDLIHLPNEKLDAYMKDLEKRGGKKMGEKKEESKVEPELSKDKEIYIHAPAMGDFPAKDFTLKYNKDNFKFDVFENGKKSGSIGEKNVLSNLENGSYVKKDSKPEAPTSDIPEKVIEHFKDMDTNTPFTFLNSSGGLWRRDNKDGKIIRYSDKPETATLPKEEEKPAPKEEAKPAESKVITDAAEVQKIKNSIQEGELMLRAGTSNGKKLSKDQLEAIQTSVNNSKAKIGMPVEDPAKIKQAKKSSLEEYFKSGTSAKEFNKEHFPESDQKGGKLTVNALDIFGYDAEVKVAEKPIAVKKVKDTAEALKDIVSSDDLRPAMTGIYYDKGIAMATDAHKLVVSKTDSEHDGKIIDPKTGKEIDARFPQARVIIPDYGQAVKGVDLNGLLSKLNGMVNSNKLFKDPSADGLRAKLKVDGGVICVNPELALDALKALAKQGVTKVNIATGNKDTQAIVVTEDSNNHMALIMPVVNSGDLPSKTILEGTQNTHNSQFVKDIIRGKDLRANAPDPEVALKPFKEFLATKGTTYERYLTMSGAPQLRLRDQFEQSKR